MRDEYEREFMVVSTGIVYGSFHWKSLKLYVTFAEYLLFYRALLQKIER